jgi:guanylate kinase
VIQKRMQKSWDEISHWDGYDYVLVNDDLDVTFERLKTIVSAERLRQPQQPGLVSFVRGLQSEFQEDEQ